MLQFVGTNTKVQLKNSKDVRSIITKEKSIYSLKVLNQKILQEITS